MFSVSLTIIDANHIYEEAKANFTALKSVDKKTYSAAFHDYGLHDLAGRMGVWRALEDVYPEAPIFHIGDSTFFSPCHLHSSPAPADGTFFKGTEGALIILNGGISISLRTPLSPKEQRWLDFGHWGLNLLRSAKRFVQLNQHKNAINEERESINSAPKESIANLESKPAHLNLRLVNGKFGDFLVLSNDCGVGQASHNGHWRLG